MPAQRVKWIKLWEQALDHPKIALLPDGLFRTWVHLLIAASQQPKRWQFASAKHAAVASGRPPVHITKLIAAGLLDTSDSDVLTVHDWKDWQEVYPSQIGRKRGREHSANTVERLGHDLDKKGEERREKREGRRETTLSTSSLTIDPTHTPPGESTGRGAANAAAAPQKNGVADISGGDDDLEPLLHEFDSRGLGRPQLLNRFEQRAAGDLLRLFGAETVALCWKDMAESGDKFDRDHLSFEYLAKGNRIGNWQRERGANGAGEQEYDEEKYGPVTMFRRPA